MASIKKIEGIGNYYANLLSKVGIKTVSSLLKESSAPNGRAEISKKTGIPYKLISKWAITADLFRIKGMGEEYSDLLEEVGVSSAKDLSKRNAEELLKKISELIDEKKIVRKPPNIEMLENWIGQSKKLPSILVIDTMSKEVEKTSHKRPLSLTFIAIYGILFLITSLAFVLLLAKTNPLSGIAMPFLIFGLLSIIISACLLGVNARVNKTRAKGFKYVIMSSGGTIFIAMVLLLISLAIGPSTSADLPVAEETESTIEEIAIESTSSSAVTSTTEQSIAAETAQVENESASETTSEKTDLTVPDTTSTETTIPPETTAETTAETVVAIPTGPLKVHFINVGQGDATLIQTPEGNTVLIDGGPTSSASSLLSYLKSNGVSKINVVIATHPHEDHIGGLISVFNNFTVDNVIDLGVSHTTNAYKNYLNAINTKNINFIDWDLGQSFDIGDNLSIQIVGPSSKTSDLNNSSVVILLSYNNNKFLFAGDAESEEETKILSSGFNIKSDVLKVGHHGSSDACCSKFLNAVKPSIAVIFCGANNSYGHPHEQTLESLANIGASIYRTDLSGNIVLESDGNNINVTKGKAYTYVKAVVTETTAPDTTAAEATAPETTAPPETQPPQAGAYVGSINSDVFHYPSCHYVDKIKPENIIWFSSREDAFAHGYRPCKVCNP